MKTINRIWVFCVGLLLTLVLMTGIVSAEGEVNGMLVVGSYGDTVSYVQQLLQNLGYNTIVDGYYGVYTEASVIAFQTDYGLYVDGMVGPYTLEALKANAPENSGSSSENSLGSSDLVRGSYGEDVKKAQEALNSLGYSTLVDGDFGAYTEASVKAFQEKNGLYIDGVIGPQTAGVLFSGNAIAASSGTSEQSSSTDYSKINLSRGSYGEDVKKVQRALNDLGYSTLVDGDYGSYTENSVIAFQKVNGLYVDGVVGPITASVLFGNPVANNNSSSQTTQDASGVEELSEVQKAARSVLDQVGWDLYAAFEWSVGLNYNINLDIGYQTSQAALYSFETHASNCVGMASTFCWMARELGYTAYVVEGSVPYARGGYGEHAWVEIIVNGSTYVCDPDFEMQMQRNGYMIYYGQSGTWQYVYGYILGD